MIIPNPAVSNSLIAMEVDSGSKPASKPAVSKKRIEKRRSKKSSIAFPKYGERKSGRNKK